MILLELFLSFLKIGSFSVGGGYAALPLVQAEIVERHGWLTMSEFTDLITIAEMTPGPMAVNSATFVGIRIAGFLGALVSVFGCILPSIVIVSRLALLYRKYRDLPLLQAVLSYLRAAVVAFIFAAFLSIFRNAVLPEGAINIISGILFLAVFFSIRKLKLSPILGMLAAGVVNLIIHLVT